MGDVAIKWSESPVSGKETEARLADEAKLLAQLDDSRILRIYDLDVWLGRPFLVMEYVRGCDLAQYAEQRKIEPLDAARIVADVANAAEIAHRIGITHQDIKPHNILIDEQGKPRLADFGIARLRDLWNNQPDQPVGGTPAFDGYRKQSIGSCPARAKRSIVGSIGRVRCAQSNLP